MTGAEEYRAALSALEEWDSYLLKKSGLPGPRSNLELAHVVAQEGDRKLFFRYAGVTPDQAPSNTPGEFLAVCGTLGLGRLLADGDVKMLPLLKQHASDPRWRIRESVAMGLQLWGDVDMAGLLREMRKWMTGTCLEQRAVVAALCEPRLLHNPKFTRSVLEILHRITSSVAQARDRRADDFKTLRKTLGYGWSVAIAAAPAAGREYFEKWMLKQDRDVQWIVRENLKKARLIRMDPAWVKTMTAKAKRLG